MFQLMNYSHKKSKQYLLEAIYIIDLPYNIFPNWGKTITSLADATVKRYLSMTAYVLILPQL